MKKLTLITACAALAVLCSCSSKLGELSADNFYVSPNPLETQGGRVEAVIDGHFPAKYMKKKAVVTVTPELRAKDGSRVAKGQSAIFQGEKVLGNNQQISYNNGGSFVMRANFGYEDALHSSDLYLTFNARIGNKQQDVPAVDIADGVIATAELYRRTLAKDGACWAADSFQRIKDARLEAQVKFLINQAELRKSELQNSSVTEFVRLLQQINRDRETLTLNDVEVLAYASPEGDTDFNERLAGKRQAVSENYVKGQLDKTTLDATLTGRYTAEDWEGFRQLVQASSIQDKDVILRVLSMYQDPQEREQQIRNMSEGFRELADGILPELRRARMIINYQVVGRSDEQILSQYADDAGQLSVDELLYAAAITDDASKKKAIYLKTAQLYPNDCRSVNNLAAMELANGNYSQARHYTVKALSIDGQSAEANANMGLLYLADGNIGAAQTSIAKASGAEGVSQVRGILNIAKGNYAQAASELSSSNTNTAALAQILNNDYATAQQTLKGVEDKDAMTDYLAAIACARQGNNTEAATHLSDAISKDRSLAAYAKDDLELSAVNK